MNNKLDKSSKSLMTCDLINGIVTLFGETFLVAYFLQVSNENIVQVSIYYIIIYLMLGLGSIFLGNVMKKKPSKRVILYRWGIVIKSIYILAIVLFKENISQYFILVALFYGMADSLYWATHDVMNIEIVDNINRKKYMTTKRILSKLIHIVVPVVLGTSIELTSFTNIAIYIFALTIVQILASLFINTNKFGKNGVNDKYSLKSYIKSLSIEQKQKLKEIYKLSFLYGIMMDTIRVLVIIITIMTFKTSLNLGILTTVFSIFSMISLYIFNKLYKTEYAKKLLVYCASFIVIGLLGFLINIDRTTLILYNFIYSITVYILEVMFKIKTDNIVKEYSIEDWIIEHHTLLDIFMESGRIIGFLLLLITGLLNNIIYFKTLLLIVTASIPLYARIMYKIEKIDSKRKVI